LLLSGKTFLIFKLQIIQQYAICYAVISLGCVIIKNDADDLPVAYICPTLMVWNYVHCDLASDNAYYGKDATDGASRLKISIPEKRRQTPLRQSRKPRPMAMLWYATDYA